MSLQKMTHLKDPSNVRAATLVLSCFVYQKQDVASPFEVHRMSDILPVVTALLTFSTASKQKIKFIIAWLMII